MDSRGIEWAQDALLELVSKTIIQPMINNFVELTNDVLPAYTGEMVTKISPNFTILNMQLFEKHPGISKPTRSHQDNGYFNLTPADAFTVWIALDDIDEENGCLYYAPGSHLRPTQNHSRFSSNTTFRVRSGVPGLSLCLHEHPDETDSVVPVKKGDVLIHHCNTIHRAGKNSSKLEIVFI